MKDLIISKNDANQRIDKFLTKYLPGMPKSMLYKSLRKNCVKVNGRHVKDGGYILKENDALKLYLKDDFFETEKNRIAFTPIPYSMDIVYEDENILLINKAAGLVVHADDRNSQNTLIEQIKSYLYEKGEYNPNKEHSFAPALCSRLDRNTSGLIIAAKNASALRFINEKMRLREIHKCYLCVADGVINNGGTLTDGLIRGNKKVKITDTETSSAKKSVLKYTPKGNKNGKTLLHIELLTGRTHQIRAQLAAAGHPLSGDLKYGGSKTGDRYKLTSYKLSFDMKDSGMLDYLNKKSFEIKPDFADYFVK